MQVARYNVERRVKTTYRLLNPKRWREEEVWNAPSSRGEIIEQDPDKWDEITIDATGPETGLEDPVIKRDLNILKTLVLHRNNVRGYTPLADLTHKINAELRRKSENGQLDGEMVIASVCLEYSTLKLYASRILDNQIQKCTINACC